MAGLDPAIHVFATSDDQDVDARDFCANARKTRFALLRGHDDGERVSELGLGE